MEQELPIRDFCIQNMLRWCPGTAADALPLLMWVDIIANDNGIGSSMTGNLAADLAGIERSPVPPGARFQWRHRDFFSLYIVRHGRGTHFIEGLPYGIARGDVYAMGLGMAHYFAGCDYLELDTLHFSPQIFDTPMRDALAQTPGFPALFLAKPPQPVALPPGLGRWLHLTPDAYASVAQMVAELRAEWLPGTMVGTMLTRGLFLRLLVHLSRLSANSQTTLCLKAAPTSARGEAIIADAVRYMDEHFIEPIRIEQIAALAFLSPDRFREVFAAVMGCTPCGYLRCLRLEHARTLLRTTELSITDIAQQTGFGEGTYFTRVFRSMTGMTPSAYRRGMTV
jgi:AraC-like DNA-binding protein